MERPDYPSFHYRAVCFALLATLAACAVEPATPVGGVIAKPVGLAAIKACYSALPGVPSGEAALFMATFGCPILGAASGLMAEQASAVVVVGGVAAALQAADSETPRPAQAALAVNREHSRPVLPPSQPLSPAERQDAESAFEKGLALAKAQDSAAWGLLCKAADLGHPRARMELAHWHRTDMHLRNELPDFRAPLARDDQVAYMWFRLAEADEAWGALASIDALARRLDETERAAADQMARDWRPGHCPVGPKEAVLMSTESVIVP